MNGWINEWMDGQMEEISITIKSFFYIYDVLSTVPASGKQ